MFLNRSNEDWDSHRSEANISDCIIDVLINIEISDRKNSLLKVLLHVIDIGKGKLVINAYSGMVKSDS